MEWRRGEYTVSDDRWRVDRDVVHRFLHDCYWARGITRETVERAIRHSLCFGIYHGRDQVGFGRMVTDHATFAYLADVFVVDAHRGRGLSKFLMECVVAHPSLQGLRRMVLATRDAHGLYARFGFHAPKSPAVWMEIHDPDVYVRRFAGPQVHEAVSRPKAPPESHAR
jgi:GNAT superfamily N-acetyltransferase